MFVVGQALFETGMANKIGGLVTKFAKTEKTLIVAIMVIVGVMSGFLSNTGTAAVLIPVVCGIADESGYSRSRLLMPLVFAAALGGNLSIIGAPGNLMGVNALQEMGLSHQLLYVCAGRQSRCWSLGILYFALHRLPVSFRMESMLLERVKWKSSRISVVYRSGSRLVSLVVLVVVIFAMIFEEVIGISIQVSACVGCRDPGADRSYLTEKEALKSIDSEGGAAFRRFS